ncbi:MULTISPECIES: AMP-binding protein [Acinetobacter]|uniref:AMP-binding protein n=1 Tax=Acinetobacter TaxID=469 RepID=UPI000235F505|nr:MULTISPECIES: AMP-binding protein [Acinetobacter]KXZ74975.1 D-alanine--poly(phosphoribitol) ligase subunit 1 [Acinetobacter venetianus]GAB02555.1 putative acyl-CoA synthetase [Acinetobacter sp. NBRC 100985]
MIAPIYFYNDFNLAKIFCITSELQDISYAFFWQDVVKQSTEIKRLDQQTWALWEQDSYEFIVLLFAGLLANKTILLPPNRVRDLEQKFEQDNIYFLSRQTLSTSEHLIDHSSLLELCNEAFLSRTKMIFYTSGSTGEPKKIERTLIQLLNEVRGLAESFELDEQCVAIATVSHQHIYGLLFKLLLPLATQRCFFNPQLAFPEDVIHAQDCLAQRALANYVISSPALLKRWTKDLLLKQSEVIFSSGGKLDVGVRNHLNVSIIEVLGSSETGGIAHRCEDHAAWTAFNNVEIQISAQSQLMVMSNHAGEQGWIVTGDAAEWSDVSQKQFNLLGRLDRIIKLEEKRLSLDAIEQSINLLSEVEQNHTLLLDHHNRQMLGCIVVLSVEAQQQLRDMGKAAFIKQLKQQLQFQLESIAIPRQWRFLSQIPQNAQSKINKNYLKALFSVMLEPVILSQWQELDSEYLSLEFPPELECFKGHFPHQPIYPGVGQISFIQKFAKDIWPDLIWCQGFEQLKFQNLIRPYTVVKLKLSRKEHKVSFEMTTEQATLASGRLLFAVDGL